MRSYLIFTNFGFYPDSFVWNLLIIIDIIPRIPNMLKPASYCRSICEIDARKISVIIPIQTFICMKYEV